MGVMNLVGRDHNGQASTPALRDVKFVVRAPLGFPMPTKLEYSRNVTGRKQVSDGAPQKVLGWHLNHVKKNGVCENDSFEAVTEDDTLIERLKNASDLIEPSLLS